MKKTNYSSLAKEELIAKIAEEKSRLQKMNLKHIISPIENPLKIRYTRREIARLSTELTKRNATA